jgi:hypothetical protein
VTGFDALRAVVAGGDGVVARFPGLVAVAQGPDDAVQQLLALCRGSAGPAPGRELARRLAAWLGGDDHPSDALRFGTVAATDGGLAVFLCGNVDLLVPDRGTALSGADAASWTDRTIDVPDAPTALTLQGAAAAADLLDDVYDLREGVVPGVAVVTVPGGTPTARPVLPVAAGRSGATNTGEHRIVDVPPPPEADDEATQFVARVRDGDRPRHGSPERPDAPAAQARPPAEQPDDRPKAEGYLCARGHLNDPRAQFCMQCGIRLDELTGVLVVDVRPPLGVLVFDDGTTHSVDTGYLLGREPEADARVRSGALRPIALDDRTGAMSRVHAEIRLENWDVVLHDSGSSNGTFVAEPGATAWSPLLPERSQRLVPGMRVRLGQRTFTLETPSGVR